MSWYPGEGNANDIVGSNNGTLVNGVPVEQQQIRHGDQIFIGDSVLIFLIEEGGKQLQILRDNMPFGRPGHGEFGTYFIGYCRTPRVTGMTKASARAAPLGSRTGRGTAHAST